MAFVCFIISAFVVGLVLLFFACSEQINAMGKTVSRKTSDEFCLQ